MKFFNWFSKSQSNSTYCCSIHDGSLLTIRNGKKIINFIINKNKLHRESIFKVCSKGLCYYNGDGFLHLYRFDLNYTSSVDLKFSSDCYVRSIFNSGQDFIVNIFSDVDGYYCVFVSFDNERGLTLIDGVLEAHGEEGSNSVVKMRNTGVIEWNSDLFCKERNIEVSFQQWEVDHKESNLFYISNGSLYLVMRDGTEKKIRSPWFLFLESIDILHERSEIWVSYSWPFGFGCSLFSFDYHGNFINKLDHHKIIINKPFSLLDDHQFEEIVKFHKLYSTSSYDI